MNPDRVVVVGAGIAGLVAARELAAHRDVVVLDKGRGVGGRVATRRIGDARLDHGAQFVTVRGEWFDALIGASTGTGVVAEWFRGEVGPKGPAGTGHPRWYGIGGMSGIAKHLAQGLDVRTGVRVAALVADDDGWTVHTDGETVTAGALVLTPPVPQTLDLLDAGGIALDAGDATALASIAYEPCTAVMALLRRPIDRLAGGPVAPGGDIAWIADHTSKRTSLRPAVTVHTSAEYSIRTWDTEPAALAAEVLAAAGIDLGSVDGDPQLHRWRYARPTVVHPADHLRLSGTAPAVLAGDAFGGALVEGAATSGLAAARALLG